MRLPVTFQEVVEEIHQFTDLPRAEVEHRVWMQAIEPGWNVIEDVQRYGVTPYMYDEAMERLYREGDGFIFDSLVFWARPARQLWIHHGADRIRQYAAHHDTAPAAVRILMFGDGPGNDALYLIQNGFNIDYFEVPGSQTFAFAVKRFEHYGCLEKSVHLIHDYDTCLDGDYDVLVSFEVLEHLPQPVQAIADMNRMLKHGGLAIVTDDFGDLASYLPTHLKSTARYLGKTPFLFARHGMALTWYSRDELFKPYEFEKHGTTPLNHTWKLLRDDQVRALYLSSYVGRLTRFINKLPYYRVHHER